MITPTHVPGPGAISAAAARWDLEDALTQGTATIDMVDAYVDGMLTDADAPLVNANGYQVSCRDLLGWPE